MSNWMNVHDATLAELHRRYRLGRVDLKHPFPERPWRLLGLLKFDGEAYCSMRFLRRMFGARGSRERAYDMFFGRQL